MYVPIFYNVYMGIVTYPKLAILLGQGVRPLSQQKGHRMKKSILLFCLTIILCLTCSCKRQADNTPAGSGYDGKYICEQTYFAFIDESNNVAVKNVDGERKITDTGDVVKIAGGEAGIVVLNEAGTLAMYVPGSDEWISQKDLDRIGPEGNIMQQVWKLVLSAGNVEDIAYNGFNYLAVKVDGEWTDGAYNNRCQPWNEQQLTKIVFDYTGNCEIGLKKDGTVWGSDEELFEYGKYNKKGKKIVDIDCAFNPFLLYEDGTVEAIDKSTFYAGDVSKWENVCQITVDAFVSAALTEDGKVLVRASQNDELFKATEWENIVYIKADTEYILGVDKDGNRLIVGKQWNDR